MAETVRWTLSVSKDVDIELRTFLARSGLKKGDLSAFVEDAVRWRLMKLNVNDVRERNAHMSLDEIEAAIGQSLGGVREQVAARFR